MKNAFPEPGESSSFFPTEEKERVLTSLDRTALEIE
jgi:hypothetical protein